MDCRHADRARRSAAFAAWRWIAAALFVACVDGPTSPGRFGELRIRPSYAAADGPTELGFVVDSARVRIARASSPATFLVDSTVAYSSDTASLGWLLDLLDDQESMLVDVIIWDDGAQLYSGEREVQVNEGTIGAGAADLPVVYIGPPIVAIVTATPVEVVLDALGASVTLAAEARDRHNQVITTPFTWTSGDASVARVDPATGVVTAVKNGTTTVQAGAGGKQGAATVMVNQRVASVVVTPSTAKLTALGATLLLSASAQDSRGSIVAGTTFGWTSSKPSVASVDAESGEVTAVAGGSATITARGGGVADTARVVVNPTDNVASIAVSPANASLTAIGATQQLTAVARDKNGNVLTGVQFDWTSGADNVATIDSAGVARAVGHGATTVTATAGTIAGSATLTVDLIATIESVVVTPATTTLTTVGAEQQFTAEARDATGVVVPVTAFEWTSSAPDVATVGATGLAMSAGQGTTTISARAGSVTGTASVSVNLTASVASIVVAPGTVTLTAVGATQQFTAVARDASGGLLPGVQFSWTTGNAEFASVDPVTGVARAVGHGATTVTAAAGAITGSATLTVDLIATIESVVVTPATTTLTTVGAVQQFTAEARDASGAVVPVTAFEWASSAPDVATVGATGLAMSAGQGTTTISARAGLVTGTASLGVDLTPSVASIVVTPGTFTLTSVGATQQFTAVARDASDNVLPGVQFSWSTGVAEVATIDPVTGVASAVGHGATAVTATAGAVAGSATLTVDLIATIEVTPATTTLTTVGAEQQFTAEARDATGAVVAVTAFEWTSSAPDVATVNPTTGLATAAAQGTTTISARAGSVTGTASVSVNLTPSVASIVVAPGTVTLTAVGATQQFTAVARDANDNVLPGVQFSWSTGNAEVASVDPVTGVARAVGYGATTVTATAGAIAGSATLTVDLSIASVVVTPGTTTLTAVGATQQFTAEARDASGTAVPVAAFAWSSSASEVATIDPATGLVTAAAHGTTTIVATVGTVTGTANVTVDLSERTASIVVTPATFTLTAVGATTQFTAEALDVDGAPLPGVPVTWSGSTTNVATIDPATGVATALTHGVTTIVASAGGVTGNATLNVDLSGSVATIVVSPATATLTTLLAQQQFTAVAQDADGAVVPGIVFAWSSSIPAVATIDQDGRASARVNGVTTIAATVGSVSGTATLTVHAP